MHGSSIIVTGGGSGMGAAAAGILAREGARLCIADINPEGAEQTVARIARIGGTAFATVVNVCEEDDNVRMVEETLSHFGEVTGLFLNAGIAGASSIP